MMFCRNCVKNSNPIRRFSYFFALLLLLILLILPKWIVIRSIVLHWVHEAHSRMHTYTYTFTYSTQTKTFVPSYNKWWKLSLNFLLMVRTMWWSVECVLCSLYVKHITGICIYMYTLHWYSQTKSMVSISVEINGSFFICFIYFFRLSSLSLFL